MKKTAILTIAIAFISFSAMAQSAGELRLGGGLALGTEAGLDDNGNRTLGAGINVGGEYLFTDNISLAPSFTWYFPSKIEGNQTEWTLNISSLNIDGRYYFLTEGVEVYGMAGICLAFAKATFKSTNAFFPIDNTSSDSEVGLNIGVGLNYPFSEMLRGNFQVKYHTEFEMAVLNFGVAYSLN